MLKGVSNPGAKHSPVKCTPRRFSIRGRQPICAQELLGPHSKTTTSAIRGLLKFWRLSLLGARNRTKDRRQ